MEHRLYEFLFLAAFTAIFHHATCQRICRDRIHPINAARIESLTMRYDASNTTATGRLLLNVSWEISHPAPIDGILLKVRATHSSNQPILRPLEPCVPAIPHIWLSKHSCQGINNTSPQCADEQEDNSTCICDNSTCSIYHQVAGMLCKGTAMKISDESFTPYSANTRWATFDAAFFDVYQADLHVYSREYFAPLQPGVATNAENFDCPTLISSQTSLTFLQAASACCDLNVTHLQPIHVREMTSADLTSGTLTLTITWLLPGLHENLQRTSFRIRNVKELAIISNHTGVQVDESADVPPELMNRCYNTTYGRKVAVAGLMPGENYTYTIQPLYDSASTSRFCPNSNCQIRGTVYFPNTTLCDPVFNACDSSSECMQNGTQYYCRQLSTTQTTPTVPSCNVSCVPAATCMGHLCTCPLGKMGDGTVGGTGCNAGNNLSTSLLFIAFLQACFYLLHVHT